jgi:hypothetical protein
MGKVWKARYSALEGYLSDFTNFRAVYDELTDEVLRAQHQFIPDHLRNWIELIDSTPEPAQIVGQLERGVDFRGWWDAMVQNYQNTGGASVLQFPDDPRERLGMKMQLFRAAQKREVDLALAGHLFSNNGDGDINVLARGFIDQVFRPFAAELRRNFERQLNAQGNAPASDRTVRLDHNSVDYRAAADAVENLERTIKAANDFADADERDQRIAEVGAVRRLLSAVLVRVEPIISLLRPLALQFAKGVKDSLVAIAVTAAVSALIALFHQFLF